MAWGKSDEEKAAEVAMKEAQQLSQAEQRQRQAYLASPVGLAETARQRGDGFFHLELDISTLGGPASSFGSSANQVKRSGGRPDLLGQIEEMGWRLEHVGYVFVETGSTSTNRVLSTGQGSVTRGVVQGIYLFRAA
jgi:hypothetical protein